MDLDGPFYSKLDLKKIKLFNLAFALYFLSKRHPTVLLEFSQMRFVKCKVLHNENQISTKCR